MTTNDETKDSLVREMKAIQKPLTAQTGQTEIDSAVSNKSQKELPRDSEKTAEERYMLVKTLGEGGMGVVQLVQDSILLRQVALKTIKNTAFANRFSQKQQMLALRLKREAEITAVLEHPNIIPLYDMQQKQEGDLYFTMRKVEGETFRSLLEQKKKVVDSLGEEEILKIFNKVCDAVSYAHSKGIIHRDLKPENIMVGSFGEVYVMDWGIAKRSNISEGHKVFESKITSNKSFSFLQNDLTTEEGVSNDFQTIGGIGTFGYMPPEQEKNAGWVTPQSDIYALGKILRECFTLQSPMEEMKEWIEWRSQHVHSQSKNYLKEESRIKISLDIEAIVNKATQQKPEARYTSVRDLTQDLDRYMNHKRVSVREYGFLELLKKWFNRNKFKVIVLGNAWMLILFFLLSFWGYQTQQNQKKFDAYLKFAKQAEKAIKEIAPQDKEKSLEQVLRGLHYTNTALAIKPANIQAETAKLNLTQILVRLACETQNYLFAQYFAQDIKTLTSVTAKRDLEADVQTEKTKLLKQHQKRLKHWKTVLQYPEKGMSDEAVLEISKMNENEIFEELIEILEEGKKYFLQTKKRTPRQNEYYGTMLKSLGFLENPNAGPHLWSALSEIAHKVIALKEEYQSIADIEFMVMLVRAIQYSKSIGYASRISELTEKLGPTHTFTKQTQPFLKKLFFRDQSVMKKELISEEDYYAEAIVKSALEDYDGAIDAINEIIKKYPQNSFFYDHRGFLKLKKGDDAGALLDFNEILALDPSNSEAYNNRGIAKLNLKKIEEALHDFSEAIRLDPRFAEAYSNRGNAKIQQENYLEAIDDLTESLRLNPYSAESYTNRGVAKENLQNFSGALEDYKVAIRLNPEHVSAYKNRAVIKGKLEDFDGALSDCDTLIQLDPQDFSAYTLRGIMKVGKGDLDGAIDDHSESIRLNPKNSEAYNNRGNARYLNQDISGALEDYSKAIDLEPENTESYYNRGGIFLTQNKVATGVSDLEKALALSQNKLLPQVLYSYEWFESSCSANHQIENAFYLFQKRKELDATAKFSDTLATAILNRMVNHYRKKSYPEAKADLDLFEQYASPKHPKYEQIPQLQANLEKIKPR